MKIYLTTSGRNVEDYEEDKGKKGVLRKEKRKTPKAKNKHPKQRKIQSRHKGVKERIVKQ
jgi:hypothetical protein